jgi:hypothetical protein
MSLATSLFRIDPRTACTLDVPCRGQTHCLFRFTLSTDIVEFVERRVLELPTIDAELRPIYNRYSGTVDLLVNYRS